MTDNTYASSPSVSDANEANEPRAGRQPSSFDPTPHIRKLRGRGGDNEYLDVKWSLVWLRREHPDARIITDHVQIDATMAIFRALVSVPGGGEATGYGSETAADFGDYIEKAETKAIGRALRALGYGAPYNEADDDAEPASGNNRGQPARGGNAPSRPNPGRPSGNGAGRAAPPVPSVTAPPMAAAAIPAMPERPVAPEWDTPAERSGARPEAGAPTGRPLAGAGRVAANPPRDEPASRAGSGAAPERSAPAGRPQAPTERGPQAGPPAGPDTGSGRRQAAAPPNRATPPAGGAGVGAGTGASGDDVDLADFSWSAFWPWAKGLGLDKAAIEELIGHSITGVNPGELRAEVLAARGEG